MGEKVARERGLTKAALSDEEDVERFDVVQGDRVAV
jgi:hypothetical protein